MESILVSIKKLLGLESDYDAFDTDIIIGINTALMVLNQLGVGPKEGYSISIGSETWNDFLGEDESLLQSVKTFVYLKTRLVFDPPSTSFVISAIDEQIRELEWRIVVQLENLKREERRDFE